MSCTSCLNATARASTHRAARRAARMATASAFALALTLVLAAGLYPGPSKAMTASALAQPESAPLVAAALQDDLGAAQTLGEGDLRWWGFRIYHARLIGERLPTQGNEPFALELTYYRSISRDRIVAASIDEMKRLFGEALPVRQQEQWRQVLERCFVDVREGDQLTGVYLPGHGVRFYRGAQLLADIDDQDFARAFFAIWLDPRTRDADLRAHLLGTRDGQHD